MELHGNITEYRSYLFPVNKCLLFAGKRTKMKNKGKNKIDKKNTVMGTQLLVKKEIFYR